MNINKEKPYEGFARTILVEDRLWEDPKWDGRVPQYDVLDDLGQAYILNERKTEVRASLFEGLMAPAAFFRIASFPIINKEDIFWSKNLEEYTDKATREAISKQEDCRLLSLLYSCIEDYCNNPEHLVSPNHIVEVSSFEKSNFYDLEQRINQHNLDVENVLVNPAHTIKFKEWNNQEFYNIICSPTVPEGYMYLLPAREFLGVMPNLYGLNIAENHKPEIFQKGWVYDELIGLMILNPRGIGVLKLTP